MACSKVTGGGPYEMPSWIEVQAAGGERDGGRVLRPLGSWRIMHLPEVERALADTDIPPSGRITVDGSRLEALDTSGALVLFRFLDAHNLRERCTFTGFRQEIAAILELTRDAARPPSDFRIPQRGLVARIGESTYSLFTVLSSLTSFIGESFVWLFRTMMNPRALRVKELVAQLEYVCIDAIPIVALVTFLIGIVIAYLFGIQIEKYGANIFIVDGVGLAMCRELSPILVAIIVAGRSGSAFTAQIGTMKINEEIDAMTTLGLSPMSVLVVPRILALMIAMPLLVFVGDVVGIIGSMVIADLRLGVTGSTFLERLHVVLPVKSFFVGLFKAPVFAIFIAMIGCHLGLQVESNARSVGINTTATVVRSIVAVILLNAAFAVIFSELKI